MSEEMLLSAGYKKFAPGYYIDNRGIVYSTKTKRYIKPTTNMDGYLTTEIRINGVRKKIYNHIKVVEMFGDKNGNRIYPGLTNLLEHGISIDHIDNDKMNPRQSNLELVAHKLNCQRREERKSEICEELGF